MSIYLGIDFGTSTNYIVRWDNKNKKIIEEQFTKKELTIFSIGLVSATLLFLSVVAILGTIVASFIPNNVINILNIIVGIVIIGFGIRLLLKKD